MAVADPDRPWVEMESLVDEGDAQSLGSFLESLTPFETARAISRLEHEKQIRLLTLLDPEEAADLIEELSDVQGSDIVEILPADQAAAIVDAMESDHRADILGEMDDSDAEAILVAMDPGEAEDARQLMEFDDDVAGGLMVTEFVTYSVTQTVQDVLADLRKNAEYYSEIEVQYAYVQSEQGRLIGVLRIRDLVLTKGDVSVASVMVTNPIYVTADTPLEELDSMFERYSFYGLPVTDEDGRLLGVVRRSDVEEARSERAERHFMRHSGIIRGDELRNMPYRERSVRRLAWLAINLVLSALAASVILLFESTIAAITALAAIIPIVGNMCGCAGNQALAVSIREMALGIIDTRDYLHVCRKELEIALLNGACIGILLGLAVSLFTGNELLGVAVGAAIALNTLIAVTVGGVTPLMLSRMNLDPALAAGPVLMTVVDMCGFLLVLAFAAAVVA